MKKGQIKNFFSSLFSHERKTLAFILLVCLVVRMGFFIAVQPWKPEVVENVILKDDAKGYHELALALLKSHRFGLNNEPEALRTPGYPLFIVGFYILFGIRPWVVLVFQVVIESFSCFLLYHIVRRILNPKIAFISSLFYALDPFLILHSLMMYSDIVFVFFLIFGFYFFSGGFFKQNHKSALLFYGASAFLFGVATLIRPIAVYIPACFFLFFLISYRSRFKIALFYFLVWVIIFMIVLFPWLLRNHSHFGTFALSTSGPYNLLTLYVRPMEMEKRNQEPKIVQEALFAEAESMMLKDGIDPHTANPFEKAKYWKRLGLNYVRHNPIGFVKWYLYGILHAFGNVGTGGYAEMLQWPRQEFDIKTYSNLLELAQDFFRNKTKAQWVIASFVILYLFVSYAGLILGLVVTWRKHLLRDLLLLSFGIALYFILITGTAGLARFRLPAIPFYLGFVGMGGEQLFLWLKR